MLVSAKDSSKLSVRVVSPEDIIALKIQAYKNDPNRELKDKADIQELILRSRNYVAPMTIDEYFDFLDQYWELFGPLPPVKIKKPFIIALL